MTRSTSGGSTPAHPQGVEEEEEEEEGMEEVEVEEGGVINPNPIEEKEDDNTQLKM